MGPYRIERELARGGMGVVYVARHLQLDRRVALKVQLAHAADSDEADRFQIEAQAAARLNHPHIVAILEVGEDRGRPFLAMDLVEGQSLKDRIDEEGALDEDEAARITEEIAEALNYAHTRAILHRDIKPHNILLDRQGKALLTDFGLAKQVDRAEKGLTQTGQIMGTPAYMPPEQADGDLERVDRRADVYALGATLYQALTGQPPFAGQTAMQIVVKVLNEEVVSPLKLRPKLHVDLATICLKCLEKEPEERYSTAKELAQELARVRRGEPILARPVGLFGRLARRARRNQKAAGLLAGAGLLILVVSLAAAFAAEGLRRDAVKAERLALASGAEATAAKRDALEAEAEAKRAAQEATQGGRRARAQAHLFAGIHQLSLDRPQSAMGSFAEARVELGSLDPQLALAAELCARQAALSARFLGEVEIAGQGSSLRCDTSGGRLAVLGRDRVRVFREGAYERALYEAQVPRSEPALCAFFPEQGLLVLGGSGSSGLWVRAVAWPGQEQRWEYEAPGVSFSSSLCVATSRGLAISTQSETSNQVWILDAKTGERAGVLDSALRPNSGQASACSGALLPGQERALLLGYDDGTVHVWDLEAGKPAQAMHLHTDEVRGSVEALHFLEPGHFGAPGGQHTLLTGSGGGTSKRTTLVQGQDPVTLFRYSRGPVQVAAKTLTPQPLVAIGYGDGRVDLYDDTFQRVSSFGAARGEVSGIAFSQDGREVFVAQGGHLGRWSVPSRRTWPIATRNSLVTQNEPALVALSGRGQVACVGIAPDGGEGVLLFDLEEQRVVQRLPIGVRADFGPDAGRPGGGQNPRPTIRSMAFRPGHKELALSVRPWKSVFQGNPLPGRLEVWDLENDEVRRLPLEHAIPEDRLGRVLEEVGLVRYSPEGGALLQGFYNRDHGVDGRVWLRDADSLAKVSRLAWHLCAPSAVAWTPEGWLSASLDGTAAAWPKAGSTRTPIRVTYHQGDPQASGLRSFAPQKKSGEDAKAFFRRYLAEGPPEAAARSSAGLTAVDGATLWAGGSERPLILGGTGQGELYLWDRETGSQLASWEAHREGSVLACKFLPGGLILSVAQEAKLWIPIRGRYYQLSQTRLREPGADVLAVDLSGWRVAALTATKAGARALVLVDLELPELRGFEEHPQASAARFRGW